MAVFGWIVLFLLSLYLTFVYIVIGCAQAFVKYNIGGVPTTTVDKLLTIVAGVVLMGWWWLVFGWAPFTINAG